jgi:nucleotide-binding universal stress UspA family protein
MNPLFTRLLLATEHTAYDRGAESLAFELALRCGLPLSTVMPLISNPEYEALAPQIAARAESEAAVRIADLRAVAGAAGVDIALHVRRGEEPYQEIVEEARAQASDMLIIRRRGQRSFLANLLVGEMVSKVVAHAPCHVLIVPRGARMWTRRVLVAAEPGPQGLALVDTGVAVAAQCQLPLQVVSVVAGDAQRAPAEAFVGEMQARAAQGQVACDGEVRSGRPFTEILAAAAQSQADLIVMGSRGDTRIGRAMVGGVAQKVMGLAEHPVLVLHG